MATAVAAGQKGKSSEGKAMKRPVQEIRAEIRSYIRNERDTVSKKWMALKETIHSEDCRRDQFYKRKFIEDTKALPLNVLKFIGTLKKALRVIMRDKGGTSYSIVRNLFIYWDADRSGSISANELFACMKSLGVKIGLNECQEIVNYYRPKGVIQYTPDIEMDYRELLFDLQQGEPTIIQNSTSEDERQRDLRELRFEDINDNRNMRPVIIDRFIEAVRQFLLVKMRDEGGTPQYHIRQLFIFYDYDYSNGLDYKELSIAVKRGMNLNISDEQAKTIVEFYDRKKTGQMTYEKFVVEVCSDVKPILHFVEFTPEEIAAKKRSLESNPFIPKRFESVPNKILEKFKNDLRKILIAHINKSGGSIASWIREAFSVWDRHFSCKISDPRILQGAAKRIGVSITEDEARIIMKCYDPMNNGEMHYNYLIHEMTADDEHFLNDGSLKQGYNRFTHSYEKAFTQTNGKSNGFSSTSNSNNNNIGIASAGPETITPTARTPSSVNILLNRVKRAVQSFIIKSKGKLSNPVDILHGTFIRFDKLKTSKISSEDFQQVLIELKISFDQTMVQDAIAWFDSDGTATMDYNLLIKQIFGNDYLLENFNIQEYEMKMKQLTSQRKQQLRFIEKLKKQDNSMTLQEHANPRENYIHHPKQLPNHSYYRHTRPHSHNSVTNLLSTIAMNRSRTMNSLPTNHLRPASAGEPRRSEQNSKNGASNSNNSSDFIHSLQGYIPSKFVTDTASSQAGSLLLDPATVTSNPFITTMTENNLSLPTEFGVRPEVKVKNLTQKEGINELSQQIKQNRKQIIQEKKRLEKKLLLVDEQRKQLIQEFKSKHSKEAVKTLLTSLQSQRQTAFSTSNSSASLLATAAAAPGTLPTQEALMTSAKSKNQSKPPTPATNPTLLTAVDLGGTV